MTGSISMQICNLQKERLKYSLSFPTGERDGVEFFRSPFAEADTFKDRLLSPDDVPDVMCEIFDVRTKSDKFGRVLKLPKATVDSIYQQYSDPQDRLFAVLDEFVKQIEPPPTWRVIVEALRHPLIGQHRLAQEIESKYCPRPPTDDGTHNLCPSLCMNCLLPH